MDEKLRRCFREALVTDHEPQPSTDIIWLQDTGHQPFGFWKEKLTEKERLLLMMIYDEYLHVPLPQTEAEKAWADVLLNGQEELPEMSEVRLIHFHLEQTIDDFESFHEVWYSIIGQQAPVLWRNQNHGFVVTEELKHEEEPEYSSFIEAISTDFYVDLTLLIGSPCHESTVRRQYEWEVRCFQAALNSKTNKQIFNEHEAIPYYFMEDMNAEKKQDSLAYLLSPELIEDHELLRSISVYFKHNLNLSSAAKALHMHRNSLQYRIDKFVDKTGLDIKQFSQAAIVHFLLLLLEQR